MEITNKPKEEESIEQILSDFFKELPEGLKMAIKNINLEEKVPAMVERHSIQEMERNFLRDRIRMVLMALITEDEFKYDLSQALQLREEGLDLLLEDIEKEIFAPVEREIIATEEAEDDEVETSEKMAGTKGISLENKLESIGNKHGLRVDELGTLVEEVRMVLSGKASSKDFPKKLRSKLNWDENKIDSVVKDINEQILIDMRKSLAMPDKSGEDGLEDGDSLGEKGFRDEILAEMERGQTNITPRKDTSILDRANILKEIEEGSGLNLPTNNESSFLKGNVENSEIAEENPKKLRGSLDRALEKPDMDREIFADKLSGPLSIEREEKNPETQIKKETYKEGVDPYRESFK